MKTFIHKHVPENYVTAIFISEWEKEKFEQFLLQENVISGITDKKLFARTGLALDKVLSGSFYLELAGHEECLC